MSEGGNGDGDEGPVIRPRTLLELFVDGDARLAGMPFGVFIGSVLAVGFAKGWRGMTRYDGSPLGIRVMFWTAGAAFVLWFLVSPGKGFALKGLSLGELPMESLSDWLRLLAIAALSCALLTALAKLI